MTGTETHPNMDSITTSNVDDDLKRRLEARGAQRGHSAEAEARGILRSALLGTSGEPATAPRNLADAIRAIVEPLGGIELEIAPRKPARAPPTFAQMAANALSHGFALASRNVRDFEGIGLSIVDPWVAP